MKLFQNTFLIQARITHSTIINHNKLMEALMKKFRVVIFTAMILTLTVAAVSTIGLTITGFYPGIIVLLSVPLIPIASNFYAKKIIAKSNAFQKKYYQTLTVINLLSILVVLWMTFVIMIDRVFPNL